MKRLVLIALLAACGARDRKPAAAPVPVAVYEADSARLAASITIDSPAGIFAPPVEPYCSTASDCGGYGYCSSGTCGHCSTSSDCSVGTCSSGSCGHCSTSSDCKGGTCSSGHCSNFAS